MRLPADGAVLRPDGDLAGRRGERTGEGRMIRISTLMVAVPEDRKNRESLAALMRVLMSSNEFVTLD